MSEESVSSEQSAVTSDEESRQDTGGTGDSQSEKLVPVSESIRYRKRAQAAEKELSELKESHNEQNEQMAALKEQVESLQDAVKQSLVAATENDNRQKTQGVKETRTGGARTMLQTAAKQAAHSGSRSDVQEYLRFRRAYV